MAPVNDFPLTALKHGTNPPKSSDLASATPLPCKLF